MEVIIYKHGDKQPLKKIRTHGPEVPLVGDIYYIKDEAYVVTRRIFNLDENVNLLYCEVTPYKDTRVFPGQVMV